MEEYAAAAAVGVFMLALFPAVYSLGRFRGQYEVRMEQACDDGVEVEVAEVLEWRHPWPGIDASRNPSHVRLLDD